MAPSSRFTASAPGSLMLFGEHAVLEGHPAVVAAIDRRIAVRLTPRADTRYAIVSGVGRFDGSLADLAGDSRFRFVHACLASTAVAGRHGFDIEIASDMPPTLGFGTSAAVTVALLAALDQAGGRQPPAPERLARAVEVIRAVQGRGSGADTAASLLGGIVLHHAKPLFARTISTSPLPLTAVYCGYKTPTADVIDRVRKAFANRPEARKRLFGEIGDTAARAADAFARENLVAVGGLMRDAQAQMVRLGVSTPELDSIIHTLQGDPNLQGAKISGSGLGDCAVGLGRIPHTVAPYDTHHLTIEPEGCRDEQT